MHLEEEPSHVEGWQRKRAAHITGILQLASVLRTATLGHADHASSMTADELAFCGLTCRTPLVHGHLPGEGMWAHRASWAGSMGTMPSALRSQAVQEASCGMSPRVRNNRATCMSIASLKNYHKFMHLHSQA